MRKHFRDTRSLTPGKQSASLPVSVAIAANALVEAVVFLFDQTVEVRGGGALRGAGAGDCLACRSQIIFVQQPRRLAPGSSVSDVRSRCLSLNRKGSARGHEKQGKKERFQHRIFLPAKDNVLLIRKVLP
jgi:hypothetical protein